MSGVSSQAIVVREVERRTGLGQTTYDTLIEKLRPIVAYFQSLPDSSLAKQQMINALYQASVALQNFHDEVVATITDQQKQINALAQSSRTAQAAATQAQTNSGVSPTTTAFIAVASALGGGAAGYAIRGRK